MPAGITLGAESERQPAAGGVFLAAEVLGRGELGMEEPDERRVGWQGVSSAWKRARVRTPALRLERCLAWFFLRRGPILLQNP